MPHPHKALTNQCPRFFGGQPCYRVSGIASGKVTVKHGRMRAGANRYGVLFLGVAVGAAIKRF